MENNTEDHTVKPSVSFEMFLIDTGRSDAATIGWWYNWLSEGSSFNEFDSIAKLVRKEVRVPEHLFEHSFPPSLQTLLLAWMDPQAWQHWCAYTRLIR